MIEPKYILSNYIEPKKIITGEPACNGSLFNVNGTDIILARETNYTFRKNNKTVYPWPTDHSCFTNEILYSFSEKTGASKIGYLDYRGVNENFKNNGLEDFRIVKWNDELHCTFTKVFIEYDNPQSEYLPICHGIITDDLRLTDIMEIPTTNRVEKNWQPIECRPSTYIYSYKPFTLYNFDTHCFITDFDNNQDISYSGSTPIIEYNDYNIGLIHKRNDENKTYIHFFVIFDKSMKIIKITDPFMFLGVNIEFCTSIVRNGDDLRIIFSVYDQLLYYIDIDQYLFDKIIENKLNDKYFCRYTYEKLFDFAVLNNNYKTAACMATFSDVYRTVYKGIEMNRQLDDVDIDQKNILQDELINRYHELFK